MPRIGFKHLVATVFAAVAISGCGGETATNQGQFPAPPAGAGGPVPNQAFSVNLGPLGGAQRDDLVFLNVSGGDTTVSLANENRSGSAPAKGGSTGTHRNLGRDLPPEVQQKNRERIARALEGQRDRLRPRGEVRSRFQELAAGDTTTIVVDGAPITCQKMLDEAQTVHCTILAEQVNGNPVVTVAQAQTFADAFDTNNPFRPGSGIYDQDRAAFGSEWNTNPTGGRDGDLKIVLVLLSQNTIGAGFFGFFQPIDEFSKAEFPDSNEAEILYVNAESDQFDTLATLAHEFQHMIRFNTKVIQQGTFAGEPGNQENLTIDEGSAVLAEELCGYSLDAAGGGSSFIFTVVSDYLNSANNLNLFTADEAKYGGGYLLMKYFREQFGDAALLTSSSNTSIGFSNLAQVAGLTERELFRRFCICLAANDLQGSIAPEFQYPSGFTTTSTFNIIGQGAMTLPGLVVEGTLTPPTTPVDFTILPFSPTLYRAAGGSGRDLVVSGTVSGQATLGSVLQSAPGQVSEIRSNDLSN